MSYNFCKCLIFLLYTMNDASNANKAQGSSSFHYTCENNIDQIAMSKNAH